MNRKKRGVPHIIIQRIYPLTLVLFVLFMFLTCSNNIKRGKAQDGHPQEKKYEFILPVISEELTASIDRANYLSLHYWDNFNFTDTTYCHLPEITEQAFVDYLDILPHADKDAAEESVKSLLAKAEQEPSGTMLRYFLKTTKDYLYDPNSPLRDEEFYIPVVEYIADSDSKHLNEADRQRARFDLAMMKKNRTGQTATNFSYVLQSGKTGTLHRIKSEYILLIFYNPDCHACSETITYLKQSQCINILIQQGKLKILAFYPDNDLEIWKKHMTDIPAAWLNSYKKRGCVCNFNGIRGT